MNKEELQSALEAIGKGGINVAGDLVIEKHVDYEVNNVEAGGIGIQINNKEAEGASLTNSDKDIKEAIKELQEANDEQGCLVFRNKKQWWAVFKVLSTFCNYPTQMKAFITKMTDLEVSKIDGKRNLTYDSLSKAANDVPQMATCSPENWGTLKDKSDHYKQQYDVAEFLMLQLGIKS